MSEVIRAAAKKWFYESFDCDLLEKMEKAGLIAQAEGFSISVMADLELDMEAAFDRVTAERDAALAERIIALGKELADTVTYADLLAARYGIDLGQAVALKFNEVSDRVNSELRLPTDMVRK